MFCKKDERSARTTGRCLWAGSKRVYVLLEGVERSLIHCCRLLTRARGLFVAVLFVDVHVLMRDAMLCYAMI